MTLGKTKSSLQTNKLLVFKCIGLTFGLIYGILFVYDTYFSAADHLIKGYVYQTITRLVAYFVLAGFLLYLGLRSRRKFIQSLTLSLSTTLLLLLLLEIGAHILIRVGMAGPGSMTFRRYYIDPDISSREQLFWGDFSQHTGRWRATKASHSVVTCAGDTILKRTNAVGASDRERNRQKSTPNQKRIIVLGDSFLEGTLVNENDRVSNRLEAATGREHLNFSINGSSPINYYLTYKSLAKPFEHDVVLVGLLPANDFQDYTPAAAYTLVEWPIYRPYWQGQYPNYTLSYSLNSIGQSISRNGLTPAKLHRTVDSVYSQLSFTNKIKANVFSNSGLYQVVQNLSRRLMTTNGSATQYEQFSDGDFNYMRYSLEQLAKEANGKKLVFLSIPIRNDIEAIRNGRENRFDPLMQQFCQQRGILFIPLLPAFVNYKGNLADLYVPCDGHWSKKGEEFVSDILLKNQAYQALLSQ